MKNMTKTVGYRNSSVSYFIRADLETTKISPNAYNFYEIYHSSNESSASTHI